MYLSVSGRATFVVFAQGAKMASAGPAPDPEMEPFLDPMVR